MEKQNVAYCGLYCGACQSYTKGKCPGCDANEKATWCEIRIGIADFAAEMKLVDKISLKK